MRKARAWTRWVLDVLGELLQAHALMLWMRFTDTTRAALKLCTPGSACAYLILAAASPDNSRCMYGAAI